ncbi:hypothetical protein CPC08DRAFT_817033 [Agrocybe pediades]|nr:hypothetical protein CPC08DRAFT_817033 [Agrocybe pediades]
MSGVTDTSTRLMVAAFSTLLGVRGRPVPSGHAIIPVISSTRLDAKKLDENDKNDIKIYTDGSGKGGNVGAAAVLYHGGEIPEVSRYHLGKNSTYSVFEGECLGQLLGLGLLEQKLFLRSMLDQRRAKYTFSVAVDSQESLLCHHISKVRMARRSPIIREIHQAYSRILSMYPDVSIGFRWVPAHEGIIGGDEADMQAKLAAKGAEHSTPDAVQYSRLKPVLAGSRVETVFQVPLKP